MKKLNYILITLVLIILSSCFTSTKMNAQSVILTIGYSNNETRPNIVSENDNRIKETILKTDVKQKNIVSEQDENIKETKNKRAWFSLNKFKSNRKNQIRNSFIHAFISFKMYIRFFVV